MSRDIIIVAGMASKGANISPLRMLGDLYADESVHYVDGAKLDNDELVVSSPSHQVAEIDHILEQSNNTDTVIYSQSMGALAAVTCLERLSDRNIRAVAIAPPLPNPTEVLKHPRIRERMHTINGVQRIPSFSFALGDRGPTDTAPKPVDIMVNGAYFDEVAASSSNFMARVRRLTDKGSLQLVLPTQDWNIESHTAASGLNGVHVLEGTHSLYSTHEAMVAAVSELFKLSQTAKVAA